MKACLACIAAILACAPAYSAVIEDFEAYDGIADVVVDPDSASNKVLALTPGQYVEIALPESSGVVTVDIYDFGEDTASSSAYGPRWCIEGTNDSGQVNSTGVTIIQRDTLDATQGYGYSSELSRVGSWYGPSYYGGPRQCTLENWVSGADQNNGSGRWTTWTFDVQENGQVTISAPFGSEKTQYYNNEAIIVENMDKMWLSGGRAGACIGPVASGTYAGYSVLVDNIVMPDSQGETSRPGDANCDGKVNLDDFIILKQNYGVTDAYWALGDFNADGTVDLDDFIILKQHYGESDFAPQPSYVDEFDPGWNPSEHGWRIATWSQNGTIMSRDRCAENGEGQVVQTVLAGGEPYYGGSMQTSIEFPYGRWVSRLRPSPVAGVLNSMFTKDWEDMTTGTPNDGTGFEIDIELLTRTFSPNHGEVHIAIHTGTVNNVFYDDVPLDFNPSDGYHDWGFDVLPDKVVWHVDGREIATYIPGDGIEIPTNYELFYNSWTSDNPYWIDGPALEDAHYYIDSVKFYPYTPYVEPQ